MIKEESLERREYQINIFEKATEKSTLVILPTGLGKTVIALLLIANRLQKYPDQKVLFLAPTRPLVEQHREFLKKFLLVEERHIIVFTGETNREERKTRWDEAKVVVATPQAVQNDVRDRRITLDKVSLVVFDEAHRAVGDYAYVDISKKFWNSSTNPLVLGMTASPGASKVHIEEVCNNLGIKHIETRTISDPDVIPYIYGSSIQWVKVDLPDDFSKILKSLEKTYNGYIYYLRNKGFLKRKDSRRLTKRELLEFQQYALEKKLYDALVHVAAAIKVHHAQELLLTQGITSVNLYFDRLQNKKKKEMGRADRLLLKNPNFIDAILFAKECKVEHPKIPELKRIIKEQVDKKPDSSIIVFTHYRDTAEKVLHSIEELPGARPIKIIGQAARGTKGGLKQKEQVKILNNFRQKENNILIATSVAEEGLDIPSTDMVIFYEPIPSEIRSIQRRGRTGRAFPGKVVILIARGTSDEAYYWSSKKKELQMRKTLEKLKNGLEEKGTEEKKQLELNDFL